MSTENPLKLIRDEEIELAGEALPCCSNEKLVEQLRYAGHLSQHFPESFTEQKVFVLYRIIAVLESREINHQLRFELDIIKRLLKMKFAGPQSYRSHDATA